jgi:two-component system, response regulator, stage 0 sporulation protein F
MEKKEYLTLKETAAYLRVHPITVRRWALAGEIPCFKVGKQWRFSASKIAEWAGENEADEGMGEILVVDDEEDIREVCRRCFENFGCSVREAGNGREALAMMESHLPDLVLLDLRMPIMDGPTTLARIRKQWPQIPVTIITAYGDTQLMERALEFAPFTVVKKPFTLDKLLQGVQMNYLYAKIVGGDGKA